MTLWNRLSVPSIAIISFVGCVGNIGLLKAIAQKWRQGGIFPWLLFEVLLLNLIYLIQQSTLNNLDNLGLGLPSSTTLWLVRACVQLSLRASSLVLSLTLAIERYLALRRPKIHGSIKKQCYCGCVLLVAIPLLTGILAVAYIFAEYHGLVPTGLLYSGNIYATKFTIIFQMICAIFLLIAAVYLACILKSKRYTVGKRPSKSSHALSSMLSNIRATQSLVWFFMAVSLTTFSVCLMNVFTLIDIQMIQSAGGYHEILSTVAEWIDIIGYSVVPFSLLLSSKRLLRLSLPAQLVLSDKNQEKGTPDIQDEASNTRSPTLITWDDFLKDTDLTDTDAPKFRKNRDSGLHLLFRRRPFSNERIVRSFRVSETSSNSRQQSSSRIAQGESYTRTWPVTSLSESESSFKLSLQSMESGFGFPQLSICHVPENEENESVTIGEEEFGAQKMSTADSHRSELSIISSPSTIRVHSITTDQHHIFDARNFIALKSPISLSLPEESNVDTFVFPDNLATICWQAAEPRAKTSRASPRQKTCDSVKSLVFVAAVERPGRCYANGANEGGILHLPGFIPSPIPTAKFKHKRSNIDSDIFDENASNVDFPRI